MVSPAHRAVSAITFEDHPAIIAARVLERQHCPDRQFTIAVHPSPLILWRAVPSRSKMRRWFLHLGTAGYGHFDEIRTAALSAPAGAQARTHRLQPGVFDHQLHDA